MVVRVGSLLYDDVYERGDTGMSACLVDLVFVVPVHTWRHRTVHTSVYKMMRRDRIRINCILLWENDFPVGQDGAIDNVSY